MDRLSAYAARESESETPEERQKTEEEATAKLLERLRISKEKKDSQPPSQQNGDDAEVDRPAGDDAESEATSTTAVETAEQNQDENDTAKTEVDTKTRGIPSNVKLFEIFYEQVTSLVKLQRLPIQDTIAMLVSLANLALLVLN